MSEEKTRAALEAYAAAAGAYEDAKDLAEHAQQAMDAAASEAVDENDGSIALPVAVSLPDGRQVTISAWNEPDNYTLEYAIARAL